MSSAGKAKLEAWAPCAPATGVFNALQFKELAIEWAMRCSHAGYMTDLSPSNLVDLSILRTDLLDKPNSTAQFSTGADLDSRLRRSVMDFSRETTLGNALQLVNTNRALRYEFERLLDEDLKNCSFKSVPGQQITVNDKIYAIADYRVKNSMTSIPRPKNYQNNKRKYEFQVVLANLINEDGTLGKVTNLYFYYDTNFYRFLATLRDATQLCSIPSNEEILSPGEAVPQNEDGPFPSVHPPYEYRNMTIPTPPDSIVSSPYQSENVSLGLERAPNSVSSLAAIKPPLSRHNSAQSYDTQAPSSMPVSNGFSQDRMHPTRKRRRSLRGLTLGDGPWVYRLILKENVRSGPYCYIENEESYTKMVETIKNSKKELATLVMHLSTARAHIKNLAQYVTGQTADVDLSSAQVLETELHKRTAAKRALEEMEEKRFEEEMRETYTGLNVWGDGDEVDFGEPFMKYLTRTLDEERASRC